MARQKVKPVSGQLRKAIRDSGLSYYRLARECGVTDGALSRFMRDERDLTARSMDRICGFLGLELRQSKQKGE
jgi:transcriptional regulator with XRE-family HTH domain